LVLVSIVIEVPTVPLFCTVKVPLSCQKPPGIEQRQFTVGAAKRHAPHNKNKIAVAVRRIPEFFIMHMGSPPVKVKALRVLS